MKLTKFVFAALVMSLTITACNQDKGQKAETSEAGEVQDTQGTQAYSVNLDESVVKWEGFKPAYSHHGTIALQSGTLNVENGELVGGSFVIDMNTITDLDLEDPGKKANLEGHLKGTNEGQEDDFFNVKKFPTSKFEITNVVKVTGNENATHIIRGNLTMRDVTKEVSFYANVDITDGVITATTPRFNIDRTEWNVKHLSGSFFDIVKENAISDDIALEIELKAKA